MCKNGKNCLCVHTEPVQCVPIWMCRVKYQQPVFISLILITAYSCWTEAPGGTPCPKGFSSYVAYIARCKFSVMGFCLLLERWLWLCFSAVNLCDMTVFFGAVKWLRFCFQKTGIMPIFWFMLSKDWFQRNLGELWCFLRLSLKHYMELFEKD